MLSRMSQVERLVQKKEVVVDEHAVKDTVRIIARRIQFAEGYVALRWLV